MSFDNYPVQTNVETEEFGARKIVQSVPPAKPLTPEDAFEKRQKAIYASKEEFVKRCENIVTAAIALKENHLYVEEPKMGAGAKVGTVLGRVVAKVLAWIGGKFYQASNLFAPRRSYGLRIRYGKNGAPLDCRGSRSGDTRATQRVPDAAGVRTLPTVAEDSDIRLCLSALEAASDGNLLLKEGETRKDAVERVIRERIVESLEKNEWGEVSCPLFGDGQVKPTQIPESVANRTGGKSGIVVSEAKKVEDPLLERLTKR
jgi:hypothetical protein